MMKKSRGASMMKTTSWPSFLVTLAMVSGTNMIWDIQELLHRKNSQVVPGALMLLAGALILYRHMTHIDEDGDHIKNFLGLILIQMVPLVILECKIMSTTDPV